MTTAVDDLPGDADELRGPGDARGAGSVCFGAIRRTDRSDQLIAASQMQSRMRPPFFGAGGVGLLAFSLHFASSCFHGADCAQGERAPSGNRTQVTR
jgi:hypothetical protein